MVMAHLSAWERVAVVTDVSWVANATNMFKFVMPCTVKVFSLKDRAVAESWIAAHVGTARNVVLVLTYSVVVISILVQGPTLTIGPVVAKAAPKRSALKCHRPAGARTPRGSGRLRSRSRSPDSRSLE